MIGMAQSNSLIRTLRSYCAAVARQPGHCLREGGLARNALTLMAGTAAAQVISLIVAPVLTRLYLPQDFGVLSLFVSICSLGDTVSTGRYDSSIMLPKEDEDAINLLALCILVVSVVSLVLFLFLTLLRNSILQCLGRPELGRWLCLVPLSVFLTGLYQSLSCWSCRGKQFSRLATREVTQAVSTSAMKLGLGLVHTGFHGLITGTLVGKAIGAGFLAGGIWATDREKTRFLSRERMRANAVKYSDFPRYTASLAFLDGIRRDGLILIIATLVGLKTVGWYSFAAAMVLGPIRLVGGAVSQAFYQRASEAHNAGQHVWPLARALLVRLSLIGMPGFLAIGLFGPEIFGFVFGEPWHEAGGYARLLTPWLFLQFIVSPLTTIPAIQRQQREFFLVMLAYDLAIPCFMAGVLWLGVDFQEALAGLSFSGSVYLVGLLWWIKKASKTTPVVRT